jgi:L,D-peptidoglycan transpeptidase YkuD (ErfK/YbiS/YcfS/YnhG family)
VPFWGNFGGAAGCGCWRYDSGPSIARRVPGDWATPTGLFPFGATIYGNSAVSPTTRYPYHHLVGGDWWDEQPGSPAYDTFQHVS